MRMNYFYPKNWKKEEEKLIRKLTKKSEKFYTKYKPKKPKSNTIFKI